MGADAMPDLARTDVGLVLVGEWGTTDPEHQRAAADAALDAWDRVDRPAELLSHSCLLGTDGQSLLHYIQWASEDACRRFVSTTRPRWVDAVDQAVSGIRHRRVVPYRPYRSVIPDAPAGTVGCIVTVAFETDGAAQARAWVDALADTDHVGPPGMVSAHFHVGHDGTRILNYAEWIDVASHQASVEHRPERAQASRSAQQIVDVVDKTPGVRFLEFNRYRPYRRFS